nr:hypothetical protein [Pirellula sp.]
HLVALGVCLDRDFPRNGLDPRVRQVLLLVDRGIRPPEHQEQTDGDRCAEFGAEFGRLGRDVAGQALGDRVGFDVDLLDFFRRQRVPAGEIRDRVQR